MTGLEFAKNISKLQGLSKELERLCVQFNNLDTATQSKITEALMGTGGSLVQRFVDDTETNIDYLKGIYKIWTR
jgi:hypothetical protein